MEEKDLTPKVTDEATKVLPTVAEPEEPVQISPEDFVADKDAHDHGHGHSGHSHSHSSRKHSKRSKRSKPRTAVQTKVERYTFIAILVVLLFAFTMLTAWCIGADGELNALFQKVERLTQQVTDLQKQLDQLPDISQGVPQATQPVSDELPEYALEEADALIAQVRNLQKANTVTFLAITDMHLNSENPQSETALKHAGQAMAYIRQKLNIDFAVNLGDITYGAPTTTVAMGIAEIEQANSLIEEAFAGIPNFRAVGNHDLLLYSYSQNKDYLDASELYGLIGAYNEGAVFQEGEQDRGYCYRDLESSKLRVILLNTSDVKGVSTFTAEDISAERFNTVSYQQLLWLTEALDLSEKSDAQSWSVLFLSHIPLNAASNANVVTLLNAYTQGSSGVLQVGMQQVAYDFAGSNQAKLIANIHGHLHNHRVDSVGISRMPAIGIPNASVDRNRANSYPDGFGEEVIYEKLAGTADETAFCVVTIDLSSGTVYTSAYGAGYSRQTDY